MDLQGLHRMCVEALIAEAHGAGIISDELRVVLTAVVDCSRHSTDRDTVARANELVAQFPVIRVSQVRDVLFHPPYDPPSAQLTRFALHCVRDFRARQRLGVEELEVYESTVQMLSDVLGPTAASKE
jgi:hypothetical protein